MCFALESLFVPFLISTIDVLRLMYKTSLRHARNHSLNSYTLLWCRVHNVLPVMHGGADFSWRHDGTLLKLYLMCSNTLAGLGDKMLAVRYILSCEWPSWRNFASIVCKCSMSTRLNSFVPSSWKTTHTDYETPSGCKSNDAFISSDVHIITNCSDCHHATSRLLGAHAGWLAIHYTGLMATLYKCS